MSERTENVDGEADIGPWERTIGEMRAIADELEDVGWSVVDIVAGDTIPEPPSAGSSDRFGLVYVVPREKADAFTEALAAATFEETEVYRRRVGGELYLVTKVIDAEKQHAVLLAGAVDYRSVAENLMHPARADGAMYTHVQTLDWTHLGSFRHEDYELFFEDAG